MRRDHRLKERNGCLAVIAVTSGLVNAKVMTDSTQGLHATLKVVLFDAVEKVALIANVVAVKVCRKKVFLAP